MGFIDATERAELPIFYNVVHSVGNRSPNLPNDVKLVQHLLKIYYEAGPPDQKPKGDMTIDGTCGPATMNWILKFQLDVLRHYPRSIAVDNRVDRVRNKNIVGSFTNTTYTLIHLNYSAMRYAPAGWLMTPNIIHLDNPLNVPPPSRDIIGRPVPQYGGV